MMQRHLLLFALILSIGFAAPALAHHSFAAHYDMQKTVTIQGTIVNVRLTNPHSWFFLDVKEPDGTISRWSFEAGTPGGMIRNGYKATEMPPGSMVTITGALSRDKPKVGMLQKLTTAAGKTYGMFGPQENATK
ncbi:MAG TPA: DUF6152 family protein [Vicinamibacterales bacterium]|jgi:hypothetical protein|nr:DUF6152 family protein [Vicinamibacterales bacterium]